MVNTLLISLLCFAMREDCGPVSSLHHSSTAIHCIIRHEGVSYYASNASRPLIFYIYLSYPEAVPIHTTEQNTFLYHTLSPTQCLSITRITLTDSHLDANHSRESFSLMRTRLHLHLFDIAFAPLLSR